MYSNSKSDKIYNIKEGAEKNKLKSIKNGAWYLLNTLYCKTLLYVKAFCYIGDIEQL